VRRNGSAGGVRVNWGHYWDAGSLSVHEYLDESGITA